MGSPAGVSLAEYRDVLDRTNFDTSNIDNSGANLFSSNVPEDRVRYVTALFISNTIGSAQDVNVNKVVEGGSSTVGLLSGIRISSNGDRFFSADDLGVFLPRFEGDSNIEIVPQTSSVNVTAFHYDNET